MKDIKIKKIKPMGNVIVTTYDTYTNDDLNLVLSKGGLLEPDKIVGSVKAYQKVISVGPMVRDIKEGDMVMLTFDRYYAPDYSEEGKKLSGVVHMKNTPKYLLNTITLADGQHLLVTSQDVLYIIEDYEMPK